MSDVTVTRHFSSLERTIAPFCDFISIYQDHSTECKKLNDGCIINLDADGTIENTIFKKVEIEGSDSTKITIKSDGHRVSFSGNVSRFSRPDNLFGYSFHQCIERINAILTRFDLPPFTSGEKQWLQGSDHVAFTGARITRLDLTINYSTGSSDSLHWFMNWLSGQQANRLKTGTYGENDTIDFGRGSRRVYSKVYNKASELLRPKRGQILTQYKTQLADWCKSIGLFRFETTYKSTFLIDFGLSYLGAYTMQNFNRLMNDFEQRQETFKRATISQDELTSLDKNTLAVYRMWSAGDNIKEKYKKVQFYKYRKALLPFGIDIAVRSNVVQFQPRLKIINIQPVSPPDFYQLPPPHLFKLAA